MRSKWPLIAAVAVAGVVAAGVVAAVGIALGGGSSTTTRADYQATVVNVRDRIDFALERITKSQSIDELIQRIRDASDTTGTAADQLDQASVAKGFEAENAKLAKTLHAFSDELAGTAAQFSDPTFSGALSHITSLSFPQWDKVNAILANMKSEGIDVQPLARH